MDDDVLRAVGGIDARNARTGGEVETDRPLGGVRGQGAVPGELQAQHTVAGADIPLGVQGRGGGTDGVATGDDGAVAGGHRQRAGGVLHPATEDHVPTAVDIDASVVVAGEVDIDGIIDPGGALHLQFAPAGKVVGPPRLEVLIEDVHAVVAGFPHLVGAAVGIGHAPREVAAEIGTRLLPVGGVVRRVADQVSVLAGPPRIVTVTELPFAQPSAEVVAVLVVAVAAEGRLLAPLPARSRLRREAVGAAARGDLPRVLDGLPVGAVGDEFAYALALGVAIPRGQVLELVGDDHGAHRAVTGAQAVDAQVVGGLVVDVDVTVTALDIDRALIGGADDLALEVEIAAAGGAHVLDLDLVRTEVIVGPNRLVAVDVRIAEVIEIQVRDLALAGFHPRLVLHQIDPVIELRRDHHVALGGPAGADGAVDVDDVGVDGDGLRPPPGLRARVGVVDGVGRFVQAPARGDHRHVGLAVGIAVAVDIHDMGDHPARDVVGLGRSHRAVTGGRTVVLTGDAAAEQDRTLARVFVAAAGEVFVVVEQVVVIVIEQIAVVGVRRVYDHLDHVVGQVGVVVPDVRRPLARGPVLGLLRGDDHRPLHRHRDVAAQDAGERREGAVGHRDIDGAAHVTDGVLLEQRRTVAGVVQGVLHGVADAHGRIVAGPGGVDTHGTVHTVRHAGIDDAPTGVVRDRHRAEAQVAGAVVDHGDGRAAVGVDAAAAGNAVGAQDHVATGREQTVEEPGVDVPVHDALLDHRRDLGVDVRGLDQRGGIEALLPADERRRVVVVGELAVLVDVDVEPIEDAGGDTAVDDQRGRGRGLAGGVLVLDRDEPGLETLGQPLDGVVDGLVVGRDLHVPARAHGGAGADVHAGAGGLVGGRGGVRYGNDPPHQAVGGGDGGQAVVAAEIRRLSGRQGEVAPGGQAGVVGDGDGLIVADRGRGARIGGSGTAPGPRRGVVHDARERQGIDADIPPRGQRGLADADVGVHGRVDRGRHAAGRESAVGGEHGILRRREIGNRLQDQVGRGAVVGLLTHGQGRAVRDLCRRGDIERGLVIRGLAGGDAAGRGVDGGVVRVAAAHVALGTQGRTVGDVKRAAAEVHGAGGGQRGIGEGPADADQRGVDAVGTAAVTAVVGADYLGLLGGNRAAVSDRRAGRPPAVGVGRGGVPRNHPAAAGHGIGDVELIRRGLHRQVAQRVIGPQLEAIAQACRGVGLTARPGQRETDGERAADGVAAGLGTAFAVAGRSHRQGAALHAQAGSDAGGHGVGAVGERRARVGTDQGTAAGAERGGRDVGTVVVRRCGGDREAVTVTHRDVVPHGRGNVHRAVGEGQRCPHGHAEADCSPLGLDIEATAVHRLHRGIGIEVDPVADGRRDGGPVVAVVVLRRREIAADGHRTVGRTTEAPRSAAGDHVGGPGTLPRDSQAPGGHRAGCEHLRGDRRTTLTHGDRGTGRTDAADARGIGLGIHAEGVLGGDGYRAVIHVRASAKAGGDTVLQARHRHRGPETGGEAGTARGRQHVHRLVVAVVHGVGPDGQRRCVELAGVHPGDHRRAQEGHAGRGADRAAAGLHVARPVAAGQPFAGMNVHGTAGIHAAAGDGRRRLLGVVRREGVADGEGGAVVHRLVLVVVCAVVEHTATSVRAGGDVRALRHRRRAATTDAVELAQGAGAVMVELGAGGDVDGGVDVRLVIAVAVDRRARPHEQQADGPAYGGTAGGRSAVDREQPRIEGVLGGDIHGAAGTHVRAVHEGPGGVVGDHHVGARPEHRAGPGGDAGGPGVSGHGGVILGEYRQ
ncbi:hypothetical protein KBTX_03317 [wastewater metagenome]|uniref:Uncharacterized protein n=2 Tax=unclassified sequences TaxID=12908 RepID=A0A5B8RHK3_9ZZZZ|nr:hypothetical protein KBTEX_03317 [uncultured organism]